MKISVVIPVYNAAPYLKACLDSVLAAARTLNANRWVESAECADVEIVCVDDGSTDGSGKILDEYVEKPKLEVQERNGDRHSSTSTPNFDFKAIHQSNSGVSAARNVGMAQATGDLVTFLDSDDTYDPRALEVLAEVWRKTGAEVIRYRCNSVDDHACDVPLATMPQYAEFDVNGGTETPLKRCALGAATAISSRLAKEVPWPRLSQCEDPLFVLRCLRQSTKSVFVEGALVNYLIRPDSSSREVSLSVIAATCRYLVLAYDECAAMPGFMKSHDDTCAFLSGFLDGPLSKCGKDVAPDDRVAAEAAVRTARNLLAVRDPAFAKYACPEPHDFVFSLGSSCTSTDVLRQVNLQFGSFPLDWVGRVDVGVRTDWIASGFADFLSQERLRLEDDIDDGRHTRYADDRYGTPFFHDFPVGVALSESFPAVRAKYDRRIARFVRCLKAAKSVLVVWIADFRDGHDGIHATDAALAECLDRLQRTYPGKFFSMLVIDQAEAGAAPREVPVADGRIRRISVDDRDWTQGPESWALRTEALRPYLAAHTVRDYRTSEEKRTNRIHERKAKYARFHATSWLDLFVADCQYRLFRHLQKRLTRKGVKL